MTRPAKTLDKRVNDLRRRAVVAEYLSEWSIHVAVALVVAAALALCARGILAWGRPQSLAFFAIVGLTPLTAYLRARPRFLSRTGAAAWLDIRAGSTGLVLAELETRDPAWNDHVERVLDRAPGLPSIRIRPLLTRTIPSVAFGFLAILIPITNAGAPGFGSAAMLLDKIDEQLAALEEQVRIDETPAAELRERLEQLRSELPEAGTEVQFEALDRLHESLQKESSKIAEAGESALEQLAGAESSSQEQPENAQEALEKAVAELASVGLQKGLEEPLLREGFESNMTLPEGVKLDPAKLAKLSKEMREGLAKKLDELRKAGLTSKEGQKSAGAKKKVDWSEFKEHKCKPECKEGGS